MTTVAPIQPTNFLPWGAAPSKSGKPIWIETADKQVRFGYFNPRPGKVPMAYNTASKQLVPASGPLPAIGWMVWDVASKQHIPAVDPIGWAPVQYPPPAKPGA
jgi:hypothetical protein